MSTPQQNKPLAAPIVPVPVNPGSELEQLQLEALRKQIALLDLDTATKQREEDKFQKELEDRRSLILSQVADNEAKRRAQWANERNCPHLMENMKRATRGNWSGSKRLMVTCQKCRKQWFENTEGRIMGYSSDPDKEIPGHLIPTDNETGGFKGFSQH